MNYYRVASVEKMSNGKQSQLESNDLLLSINGTCTNSVEELKLLRDGSMGDDMLTIIRSGNILSIKQDKGCTLGAVLVPVVDDKTVEDLVVQSQINFVDDVNSLNMQIEINQADNDLPKRIVHVIVFYILVAVIAFLVTSFEIFNLTENHTIHGAGKFLILVLFMPVLYLIFGKRLFR